jgi:hypothetical protein
MMRSVFQILTFTKVIKQPPGNFALVTRNVGFGEFEIQVGSLETSRLNNMSNPWAEMRDVDAECRCRG